jgi:hypothetical protein
LLGEQAGQILGTEKFIEHAVGAEMRRAEQKTSGLLTKHRSEESGGRRFVFQTLERRENVAVREVTPHFSGRQRSGVRVQNSFHFDKTIGHSISPIAARAVRKLYRQRGGDNSNPCNSRAPSLYCKSAPPNLQVAGIVWWPGDAAPIGLPDFRIARYDSSGRENAQSVLAYRMRKSQPNLARVSIPDNAGPATSVRLR